MSLWNEIDGKLGVEHKFEPNDVMMMSQASMAALLMTIETGLQIVQKTRNILNDESAFGLCDTLLQTMYEIMGAEIKKQKLNNENIIDTGKKIIN